MGAGFQQWLSNVEAARSGISPQMHALQQQLGYGQLAGLYQDPAVRQMAMGDPNFAQRIGLPTAQVGGTMLPGGGFQGTLAQQRLQQAGFAPGSTITNLPPQAPTEDFLRRAQLLSNVNFMNAYRGLLGNYLGGGGGTTEGGAAPTALDPASIPPRGAPSPQAAPTATPSAAYAAPGGTGDLSLTRPGIVTLGPAGPTFGAPKIRPMPAGTINPMTGQPLTGPVRVGNEILTPEMPKTLYEKAQQDLGPGASTEAVNQKIATAKAQEALHTSIAETRTSLDSVRSQFSDPRLGAAIDATLPGGSSVPFIGGDIARAKAFHSEKRGFPNLIANGDPNAQLLARTKDSIIPFIRAAAVTAKNLRITFPEISLMGDAKKLAAGDMTAPEAHAFLASMQQEMDRLEQVMEQAAPTGRSGGPATMTPRGMGGPPTSLQAPSPAAPKRLGKGTSDVEAALIQRYAPQ